MAFDKRECARLRRDGAGRHTRVPRQGHRGRDGDDRARLRARTAAALARARLAVRAAGRACVSPSRPGVLALALRLALEWLYLYDGGERRSARPSLFHVLRGRTAVQIGGVFHRFSTVCTMFCTGAHGCIFPMRQHIPDELFETPRSPFQRWRGAGAKPGRTESVCVRMRAHAGACQIWHNGEGA